MEKVEYTPIGWAELKVNCYGGETGDQEEPYWHSYFEGDKQAGDDVEPLVLDVGGFPPGTKVVISVPCCPECGATCEICDCGFDWKNWVGCQYS